MSTPDPSRGFALEVVRRLRSAGYQALWAGGCVRDLLLGESPADYDVATDARPEQVMATLRFRAVAVGAAFGVIRVMDPRGQGQDVEIATFRGDGPYLDGRRPESVVFGSPEIDAARRDFTINGMFLDPIENQVIDYVGGREDLKAHVLRAIGDPHARFREDQLRLLRAVRMAARLDFQIESNTRAAVRELASFLGTVSAERIAQELRKMLVHPTRARALDLFLDLGLARSVLAPLPPMRGLFRGSPMQPEGDLWDHTMLVLKLLPNEPTFPLAMAALLHDAGKPAVKTRDGRRIIYPDHPRAGAGIADQVSRSLKLANSERERVVWLVANHEVLWSARSLPDSRLKRILASAGADELLALHRADALASIGTADHVDFCEFYRTELPRGPLNPPPLLTGHDLVAHGLTPGTHFASLLERLRDAQLEGRLESQAQALEWIDAESATTTGLRKQSELPEGLKRSRMKPRRDQNEPRNHDLTGNPAPDD